MSACVHGKACADGAVGTVQDFSVIFNAGCQRRGRPHPHCPVAQRQAGTVPSFRFLPPFDEWEKESAISSQIQSSFYNFSQHQTASLCRCHCTVVILRNRGGLPGVSCVVPRRWTVSTLLAAVVRYLVESEKDFDIDQVSGEDRYFASNPILHTRKPLDVDIFNESRTNDRRKSFDSTSRNSQEQKVSTDQCGDGGLFSASDCLFRFRRTTLRRNGTVRPAQVVTEHVASQWLEQLGLHTNKHYLYLEQVNCPTSLGEGTALAPPITHSTSLVQREQYWTQAFKYLDADLASLPASARGTLSRPPGASGSGIFVTLRRWEPELQRFISVRDIACPRRATVGELKDALYTAGWVPWPRNEQLLLEQETENDFHELADDDIPLSFYIINGDIVSIEPCSQRRSLRDNTADAESQPVNATVQSRLRERGAAEDPTSGQPEPQAFTAEPTIRNEPTMVDWSSVDLRRAPPVSFAERHYGCLPEPCILIPFSAAAGEVPAASNSSDQFCGDLIMLDISRTALNKFRVDHGSRVQTAMGIATILGVDAKESILTSLSVAMQRRTDNSGASRMQGSAQGGSNSQALCSDSTLIANDEKPPRLWFLLDYDDGAACWRRCASYEDFFRQHVIKNYLPTPVSKEVEREIACTLQPTILHSWQQPCEPMVMWPDLSARTEHPWPAVYFALPRQWFDTWRAYVVPEVRTARPSAINTAGLLVSSIVGSLQDVCIDVLLREEQETAEKRRSEVPFGNHFGSSDGPPQNVASFLRARRQHMSACDSLPSSVRDWTAGLPEELAERVASAREAGGTRFLQPWTSGIIKLRSDIKFGRDFVAVPAAVWHLLFRKFHGGPAVPLVSPEISASRFSSKEAYEIYLRSVSVQAHHRLPWQPTFCPPTDLRYYGEAAWPARLEEW